MGFKSVPKDINKSFEWLRIARDQGSPVAILNLLASSWGVADLEELKSYSFTFVYELAEKGMPEAMHLLSFYYEYYDFGYETPENASKADELLKMAAGCVYAMRRLADIQLPALSRC